ncbi:MAG: hypothetical protein KQI78_10875 [Deltaproteobacteria bacterium]|nr:hypothetical protein [Deltaproteobacteria bacterium]
MRITPENLNQVYQVSKGVYKNERTGIHYKLMPQCPVCGEPFLSQFRKKKEMVIAKTCSRACGHRYIPTKFAKLTENQNVMKLIEKDLQSHGVEFHLTNQDNNTIRREVSSRGITEYVRMQNGDGNESTIIRRRKIALA